MSQLIGLIDCNNFFVSCERLFRPDLVNQAVLVLSSNDGCVVARSQEVKDMGIPMGVPYFKIKDIIKDNDITVFSGNLTLYRDISRRVFDVVRREFSHLEQYSIDEAFVLIPVDVDVEAVMCRVKDRVWQEVGIPVSMGVAASKTQAKYAADRAKKSSGCFWLTAEEWQSQSSTVPLATIWGVGRGLVERYKSAGLLTVADLVTADTQRVAELFGVTGVRLQAELRGTCVLPVTQVRPLQKSLMSSRSFSTKVTNIETLADAVSYHTRHIAADLRSMDAAAGSIRVSVQTSRHGDFLLRGGSDAAVFSTPTSDTFRLISQAQELLNKLYEPGVPYQKVGVTVVDVIPHASISPSLFTDTQLNTDGLLRIIDSLNRSVDGKELVMFGSRLQTKAWQAKASVRSGSYTTRWSDIVQVSAT